MKGSLALLLTIALGVLACTEVKVEDPNACQIGYGFGSYGCAEVTGSVLNAASQPVANANVSAGTTTDPFVFTQTSTDATGAFRIRFDRRWMMQSSADTQSSWIHVKFPAPPTPATAHDSLLVLLTYAPIRHQPVAKVITLHLP